MIDTGLLGNVDQRVQGGSDRGNLWGAHQEQPTGSVQRGAESGGNMEVEACNF